MIIIGDWIPFLLFLYLFFLLSFSLSLPIYFLSLLLPLPLPPPPPTLYIPFPLSFTPSFSPPPPTHLISCSLSSFVFPPSPSLLSPCPFFSDYFFLVVIISSKNTITHPQYHPHIVNVVLWFFLLPSSPFPSKRRREGGKGGREKLFPEQTYFVL